MTTPEQWALAREGDASAREQIILEHYEFVQRVAGKMARNLPPHVDKRDLVSHGVLGLIRAITHYDHTAGVDFETYAAPSVRSVILDELRKEDWAPRSLRKAARQLGKVEEDFEKENGRKPTSAEAAETLTRENPKDSWSVQKVEDTKRKVEASYHKSLDEGDPDRDWAADHASNPDSHEQVDENGARHAMQVALEEIRRMPALDQAVLALYYYAGEKLAGVGRELGITETRASQIHGRAVTQVSETLRRTLGQSGE